MAKPLGLLRRGGVWYLRVMVPKELRHLHGDRGKIVKSLGTTDRREAGLFAATQRAEWETIFARQRGEARAAAVTQWPTAEAVTQLVALFRHELLKADEDARANPNTIGATTAAAALAFHSGAVPSVTHGATTVYTLPPDHIADDAADPFAGLTPGTAQTLADEARRLLDGWKDDAAQGRLDVARRAADHTAQTLGLRLDWNTPEGRTLLVRFQRGMVDAAGALVARASGEPVDTPDRPAKTPARPLKLRDVLSRWESAQKDRKAKTVAAIERAVEFFEEGTGNPALSKLTRAQGNDYREWLLKQGGAAKTAAGRLDAAKMLLNFAAKELGAIGANPWDGLRIAFDKASPRDAWALSDLQRLFGAPLFQSYAVPRNAFRAGLDAAYWVPLLALFTGARVTELCQLRMIDVEHEMGGDGNAVPLLLMRRAQADARAGTLRTEVKTAAGTRRIPVHEELIRLGFLEYVAAVKAAGASQVFPAAKRPPSGNAGTYFSTWFGGFKESFGFEQYQDLHALRHTVRTRLVEAHVQEAATLALLGHEGAANTGIATYTHLSAATLREAMNRLTYPGLQLPRVYTAPAWSPDATAGARAIPPQGDDPIDFSAASRTAAGPVKAPKRGIKAR